MGMRLNECMGMRLNELLLEKGAEQINICALKSFAQNILFYLFCLTFKYTCFKRKLSIIMRKKIVFQVNFL